MNSSLLLSTLTVLLASCAAAPPEEGAGADRRVAFSCTNGEEFEVHFSGTRKVAVLTRSGSPIELQQQPSGSGFIYSNGPNTIRGKGDDLIVEIGRMTPLHCKVR